MKAGVGDVVTELERQRLANQDAELLHAAERELLLELVSTAEEEHTNERSECERLQSVIVELKLDNASKLATVILILRPCHSNLQLFVRSSFASAFPSSDAALCLRLALLHCSMACTLPAGTLKAACYWTDGFARNCEIF